MNNKLLKLSSYLGAAFLLLVMGGCVKSFDKTFTDFSTTSDYVVLQNAGYTNYGATSFNRGTDTVVFTVRVDLASAQASSSPTTVKLGVDAAAIAAYNAKNPQPGYIALPAANYKLVNTTVTIPAGQHYAETQLLIFTKGLDPAVSYMVPVSIVDASGKALSTNLNTALYHTIGNPLAGNYLWDFIRWNSADTTSARNASSFYNEPTAISPTGPTSLLLPESYIQTFVDPQGGISLTFDNNGGVLSNFKVFFTPALIDEIAAGGFTILAAPKLVSYNIVGNASTKYAGSTFRTYFSFLNSSGGTRTLVDNYVKL
ncbi:MAG: DUF1735 domain-containing protein [Candidatus Dadabacteria bacterium]